MTIAGDAGPQAVPVLPLELAVAVPVRPPTHTRATLPNTYEPPKGAPGGVWPEAVTCTVPATAHKECGALCASAGAIGATNPTKTRANPMSTARSFLNDTSILSLLAR